MTMPSVKQIVKIANIYRALRAELAETSNYSKRTEIMGNMIKIESDFAIAGLSSSYYNW